MAFAGIRTSGNNPSPFIWYNLTDNNGPAPSPNPTYPTGACSISIAAQATRVTIAVLTLNGDLFETTCNPQNVMGTDTLVCTEIWAPVNPGPNGPNPPPLRGKFSHLVQDGNLNFGRKEMK